MFEDLDRTYGAEHMLSKHHVTVEEANQALRDPERIVIEPDYASTSGQSARIIGYSETAGDLLTIIAVTDGGIEYGANGWHSNPKDRRIYREEEES